MFDVAVWYYAKDVIIFGTEEEKTDDDDQNNENKDENGSVEENDARQTALWPELSSQEFKQSVTSLK